jgi:phage tail sheath protein FI
MPEYLAPGVYVEEVSYRAKSIEGVSTTTTGLIGPSRFGPLDLEPDVITSLGEFERVYGDRRRLEFGDGLVMDNYLWHAARAFFEEGGKRLYVSRVFRPASGPYPPPDFDDVALAAGIYPDGHGRASVPDGGGAGAFRIRARFPGAAGNFRVRLTLRLGQSVLGVGAEPGRPTLGSLRHRDLVWMSDITSPISSPLGGGGFYIADQYFDTDTNERTWRFLDRSLNPANAVRLNALTPDLDPARGDQVRVVTVTVTVMSADGDGLPSVWDGLSLDPTHERDGAPDSLTFKFGLRPGSLAQARTLPIVITLGDNVDSGIDVLRALLDARPDLAANLSDPTAGDEERTVDVLLEGGNDGLRPSATEYEGTADDTTSVKTGLKSLEDIEDISIVAAPGSTFGYQNGYRSDANTIINLLISHATRMRYRIAVIDSGDGQSIADVRAMRARIDSTYAAFYYPWIRVLDPVTRSEINLPPSGFVAGIYARNDVTRAVYKAPANEVVNLAIGFETLLNKGQQDVLNPDGINCFRFFEGRGFRLWGARTASSDPEWKYVNLRRYFIYLERSIDRGSQWAVFEPNGPQLWGNVRRTIEDFLLNEWQSGALLGDKPDKAFFVRCDRSTMTQNDLDNGRLVCLVGVAPLRPAEFVIFRIGQWTADRRQ